MCQWFESTSKRAKVACNRSRERAGFGNSSERGVGGRFEKSGFLLGLVLASLCPDGRVRFECSSIGWIYMLRGGETRCSAVWSAHLFWVQRAIGSNPVTLNTHGSLRSDLAGYGCILRDHAGQRRDYSQVSSFLHPCARA